jgi:hypothetical protein
MGDQTITQKRNADKCPCLKRDSSAKAAERSALGHRGRLIIVATSKHKTVTLFHEHDSGN